MLSGKIVKTRFEWTVLLFVVALLGGAWIGFSQVSTVEFEGASELTEGPLAGYLAPDFTLIATNGEMITLSELRGQPVVLNFWATWCPPCRAEMPALQQASRDFNGQATIIGVNQGESAEQITSFAFDLGIAFPLLVDENNAVNRLYRISALPTTYFIGADGVVQEVFTGTLNGGVIADRVEGMLAEAR